ncbi:hypothetical protein AB6A40_009106 [Gnathostoma spinigerum]|uniref:PIN domain-containing protein n=1 Tax=Gnathostoma spinigerum TaxID=75299 RepID=A0ABD6EZZ1_9BILA
MTEEQRLYRQTVRDNQLKHELLEREVNEKRTVIEVHPDYIVPDTNTFIHHLDAFQKIAESEKFKIAVPVIVLSELRKLSLLIPMKSGIELFDDESPEDWVGKRAKVAIAYLEKVKDKRIFCTVTSQGNRISPLFSAPEELSSGDEMKKNDESIQSNNDDLVLLSCCKLSARLPTPLSRISDDHIHPRIYRSVVLLTDDRALNIKAVLKNIPCRTVTSFVKWAFS